MKAFILLGVIVLICGLVSVVSGKEIEGVIMIVGGKCNNNNAILRRLYKEKIGLVE